MKHSDIIKNIKARNEKLFRASFITLMSQTIIKSPVDTGRFRANWIAAIGGMDTTTTTDTDKGGSSTIGRISATINGMDLGVTGYLTNSLPYSLRLEYGHSAQAPSGIVRPLEKQWPRIVYQTAKGLRK